MPSHTRSIRTGICLGVVLTLHVGFLAWAGWCHSPVTTEVAQLPAGVSHLLLGRFDLCRINPPLVRCVGALPVVLASPRTDWSEYSTDSLERLDLNVGFDFLTANGFRSFWLFTLARWACILFSLVGAIASFQLTRELYGVCASWVALALWCFCPYVLGHAAVVTTDVPAAALGLTAMACFRSWLRSPNWAGAALVGGILGLAELTKFTLLVLFPILPVVWLIHRLADRKATSCEAWLRQGGMLAIILLVSVYVIHCGYLFDGTLMPLEEYRFRTMLFTGCDSLKEVPREGANRFKGTWLGKLPVPLPADMVRGIDMQRYDFERGFRSYLRGRWADHGWWYYYLYALVIKVPLGTWLLSALAIGLTVFRGGYSASWHNEMVVLLPFFGILVFVSSQTGFSAHSRYIVPALPFLFVWTSKVAIVLEKSPHPQDLSGVRKRGVLARTSAKRQRALATTVTAAVVWSITSSLWAYPHSLSFFNELVGGPRRGPKHLLDSNIDWGQDLHYLKIWVESHPEGTLDGLIYDSPCPATLAGIPETRPPPTGVAKQTQSAVLTARESGSSTNDRLGPQPGWYALSVNLLYDRRGQFRYFLRFQPVAMAGYSIYIYHVTLDDANRVRRELGLSELPPCDVAVPDAASP